jgi:predicted HicB family RNase H-like nuclease
MSEKRVNIRIPEDVHTKAKVIAVLKDMTLNDYLKEAIEAKLEQDHDVLDDIPK